MLPLHAPPAEQLVAFVEDHDRSTLWPTVMLEELVDRVTVGGEGGAVTASVAELVVVPPGPVHLIT